MGTRHLIIACALLLSACGGDSPTAPTTPTAAGPVTSVTPLTISGGDPACPPLNTACKVIGPYKATGTGPITARLFWADRDTNLILQLADAAGRTVASGGDQVRTAQGITTTANSAATRGDYYVYVFWVWGSAITPLEVTVTYPGA